MVPEGDLLHMTTGWVGAPIVWDFSCDGWILFHPATDKFPFLRIFGWNYKKKKVLVQKI